jgi:hypothetical protein
MRALPTRIGAALIISLPWNQSTAAPSVPGPQPVSLLNITLGKPLTVPLCQPKPTAGTCAKELSGTDYGQWSVRDFYLQIMSVDRPDFVKITNGVMLNVIDGNVEGITLSTTGADSDANALRHLIGKFGQPSSIQQKTAQNRFGAKYQYSDATWRFGTTEIHFEGLTSDIDTGAISAETAKLRRYYIEQARQLRESGPRL